jgi:hypothetical protein
VQESSVFKKQATDLFTSAVIKQEKGENENEINKNE